MPRKKDGNAIYSFKLQVNGATKIFTMRVGKDFTELSLAQNGKLVEILRQEKDEATHERF